MPPFEITDETELKSRVRDTSLYADNPDEVTSTELTSHIHNAQLRLVNETGSQAWYSDTGLMQALLYSTLIEAKLAIENYSVSSWDVGAGRIDVSGAGDNDQAQFEQWAEWVSQGIDFSDEVEATDGDTATNIVSNADYFP